MFKESQLSCQKGYTLKTFEFTVSFVWPPTTCKIDWSSCCLPLPEVLGGQKREQQSRLKNTPLSINPRTMDMDKSSSRGVLWVVCEHDGFVAVCECVYFLDTPVSILPSECWMGEEEEAEGRRGPVTTSAPTWGIRLGGDRLWVVRVRVAVEVRPKQIKRSWSVLCNRTHSHIYRPKIRLKVSACAHVVGTRWPANRNRNPLWMTWNLVLCIFFFFFASFVECQIL